MRNLSKLINQITEQEAKIAQLEDQVARQESDIGRLETQLQEIYSSKAWKFIKILWQLRLKLAPKESLGERLLYWLVNTSKFLKNNDPARFLRQVISKIFRGSILQPTKKLILHILPRPWIRFLNELQYEYSYIDRSNVILYAEPSLLPNYKSRRSPESISDQGPSNLRVSVISTARNEGGNVREWLESLLHQTRKPDEIVITDGGSTDGTVEFIREFSLSAPFDVRVFEAPGANISRGRNLAIQMANHPIIACTDFGCLLDKNWLKEIIEPFETDEQIQISFGYYQNSLQTERALLYARYFISNLTEINPQSFLPSSRSLAMKKTFWARVGGYPEWMSDAGEDTFFDVQAKAHAATWAFVPSALVYWQAPNTPKKILRTTYRYSKGDGEGGLFASHYWQKIRGLLSLILTAVVSMFVLLLAALFLRFWFLPLASVIFLMGVYQAIRKIRSKSIDLSVGYKMTLIYLMVARMINMSQVLGFVKGVLNRGNVRLRQVEQYQSELQQILAQNADRKGIILYPPTHDWGFMFQRPHQMARSFTRKGYLFFFCTNNEKTDSVVGFQQVEPGLYLCNVPLEIFKFVDQLIVYIGSPWHRDLIQCLDSPTFIYDHYDDLQVSSAKPEDHEWLLQHADLVLVTSHLLMENVFPKRSDSLLVPNGVDYRHIQRYRPLKEDEPPPDLKPILEKRKPIIGYSGALAEWFDYKLLTYLAKIKPKMQFVLLGTNYDGSLDRSRILEFKNVHWLGMKSLEDLYNYVWRFDVGIIPFKVNEITLATSPIKQFEYMACGKPVISTALPECKRFTNIFVADTYEEFANYLDSALQAKLESSHLASLLETAQENTWDSRVNAIIERLSTQRQG